MTDYNIPFGGDDTADGNTWGGQVITMEGNSAAAYGAGGGLLTVTGSLSPVSITVTGGRMVITGGGFISTPLVTLNNSLFDMSGAGGASGTDFDFANGTSAVYMPSSLGSNTANGMSFTNLNDGDFIKVDGTVSNLSYSQADHTLTFDLGGTTYNVDVTLSADDTTPVFNVVNGNEIVDGGLVCYARGTRIRTLHGDVAVESLRVGDSVFTASGEYRPVIWLGRRTWRRGNAPRWLWPVRIAAGAFCPGKPSRDLIVSPAHGICVNVVEEVFIPAGKLVNGATIAHVRLEEIEYWHIELESHDVLVAEGLPAESYLDCGNRDWFSGGSAETGQERAGEYHARAARPYLTKGPEVDAARARLRTRAKALGWCETDETDLHLIIDGNRVEPTVDGDRACFLVPASARDVVLKIETFCPADFGKDDHRELGVSLRGLRIRDGFGLDCTITLDHPAFAGALHPEEAGHRWTRARLALPSELWSGSRGPVLLTFTFDPAASQRWIAPVAETGETNVVPLRATG